MAGAGHAGPGARDPRVERWINATPTFVREMLAGGVAGGIAKTSVAPLERTKIMFQTNQVPPGHGVWRTLKDISAREGWRGMLKGNTATVARIIPYSAIHFWAYEHFRRILVSEAQTRGVKPGPWLDLLAGSSAGAVAVVLTYPLDLVRTRMAWQVDLPAATAGNSGPATKVGRNMAAAPLRPGGAGRQDCQGGAGPPGASTQSAAKLSASTGGGGGSRARLSMAGTAKRVVAREGLLGLYSGMGPALMGILPYSGIKFYVYQSLKQHYRHLAVVRGDGAPARLPLPLMLAFGAAAGLVGQTLTYPLDIARRRMQVQGAQALEAEAAGVPHAARPTVYRSTLACLAGVARQGGVRALFYGLQINYIKVVPSTALGFMIYDYMKFWLLLPNHL
eukprot:jgi/Tetstr1/459879/TSEL_005221.t1